MAAVPTPSPSDVAPPNFQASAEGGRVRGHIGQTLRDELSGIRPRLLAMNAALAMLPDFACCRARTHILRLAGFEIGTGSAFMGAPKICSGGDVFRRLRIGSDCAINVGLSLDLGAEIVLGDHVYIGHEVMILTSSHKLGTSSHRAGRDALLPVKIGDGAWICARATLLPGVTVGAGAVVSAGAVVNKDVPPNSIVSGTPARVVVPKLR
jgi:maltose O-acetyltransferase